MKHYQYRIVKEQYADGHELYTVQWRDDWFGTGIFWFSSWYVCSYHNIDGILAKSHLQRFFAIFYTKEDAIDFLEKRKQEDLKYEQSHTVIKRNFIKP